jgi:hypothetical protein
MMSRPRTPVGTFGDISFDNAPNGQVRARTRYRDDDGRLRRVQATGSSERAAERELKAKLARRPADYSALGELSPDSLFTQLVDVWLDDLDLEDRVAQNTRDAYERNIRLVLPAFEHFTCVR